MSKVFSLGRMAAHLGVTQAWLREQAESGKVPCLKAGSRFLFNPETVAEVLLRRAGGESSPDERRQSAEDEPATAAG